MKGQQTHPAVRVCSASQEKKNLPIYLKYLLSSNFIDHLWGNWFSAFDPSDTSQEWWALGNDYLKTQNRMAGSRRRSEVCWKSPGASSGLPGGPLCA